MLYLSEENEYGIKTNEFVIKSPLVIENDMIQLARAFFGSDVKSTSMEPLVRFYQLISEEIGDVWEELQLKLNSQSVVDAFGTWLRKRATERGRTIKLAEKASTTLTFTKTNNQGINIPSGTVVDNNESGDALIEFETIQDESLPDVLLMLKGDPDGEDFFSAQIGASNLFGINDVEWVSDNPDGSSPYTEGTDYVAYVDGDDKIDWNTGGGTEPVTGAFYYVKLIGSSIYVQSRALVAGTASNLSAGLLNHLQSSISGITNVINAEDINNGIDDESETELKGRVLSSPFILKNDEDLTQIINQLDGVNRVKIIEDVALFEVIVAFNIVPVVQSVYDSIITKIQEQKTVSSQPFAIFRVKRGGVPDTTDDFPHPYNSVWKVLWVSDNEDGSSPYTEGADYIAYSPNDDQIDWSPGGSEPSGSDYYFVKVMQAVTVAEEVELDFEGLLTFTTSNFTVAGVEVSIGDNFRAFLRAFDIDDDVYLFDFSERVTSVDGIKRLQDFRITATVRITKGAAGGTDNLPNTETYSVNWVNDEKDQSGTAYAVTADYLVSGDALDWSPGGAEPTTGNFYYVNVTFEGDLTIGQREIAVLGTLNFTS